MTKGKNNCLRICCEKTESGGENRQIGPDEISVASSNYTRYYCAQNRLKRSPPASLDNQVD